MASPEPPLPAGRFAPWARSFRPDGDADVPCDGCTACCEAAQFIHLVPEDTEALGAIPDDLLFPAPGLLDGHLVMGYDEDGRCPMLGDSGCTIYNARPATCRAFDCRVFTATGTVPDDAGIAERAARFEFELADAEDDVERGATRAAAAFLSQRAGEIGDDLVPSRPTQRAVLAVSVRGVFAGTGDMPADPTIAEVAVAVRAHTERR